MVLANHRGDNSGNSESCDLSCDTLESPLPLKRFVTNQAGKEKMKHIKLPKHKVLKAEFFQDSAKIRPQYGIQLKQLPHQSPRVPRQHVEQVQASLRASW
jgi:DNA-directed RNA polymerase subunit H (RpoH/RPB5)